MNILGAIKKVFVTAGKGILAFESNPYGQLATNAVAGMFGGPAVTFTSMVLKLMGSSTKAVASTELLFADVKAGTASAEKKAHAMAMVNDDLQAYRDIADATGQNFSIDQAEVDKLVEATLDYIDQVQKTAATVKMTPKIKPASTPAKAA